MKVIDCEFHYYLPELMDYLATRDKAMRYYPDMTEEEKEKVFHLNAEKYILDCP